MDWGRNCSGRCSTSGVGLTDIIFLLLSVLLLSVLSITKDNKTGLLIQSVIVNGDDRLNVAMVYWGLLL